MGTDKDKHGFPFFFAIHSRDKGEDQAVIFDAFDMYVRKHNGGIMCRPDAIVVDDAEAEINAIQACAWGQAGTRVELCTWHVKRAVKANLIRKIRGDANVAARKRCRIMDAFNALQATEVCLRGRTRVPADGP